MHRVSKWLASQNVELPSFCEIPSFIYHLPTHTKSTDVSQSHSLSLILVFLISIIYAHEIICGKEIVIRQKVYYEFGLTVGTRESHLATKTLYACMLQLHHNGKWIEYLSLYTRSFISCNRWRPEFEWICFIADSAHFCNVVVISISEMRWLATVLLAYKWNTRREKDIWKGKKFVEIGGRETRETYTHKKLRIVNGSRERQRKERKKYGSEDIKRDSRWVWDRICTFFFSFYLSTTSPLSRQWVTADGARILFSRI